MQHTQQIEHTDREFEEPQRITRPVCAPLCIAIDCPQERQLVWAMAANDAGFMMRDLCWNDADCLVRSWRPPVVMVTAAVLQRKAHGLRALAAAAGAALVVVSARSERSHLRNVLAGVLRALQLSPLQSPAPVRAAAAAAW